MAAPPSNRMDTSPLSNADEALVAAAESLLGAAHEPGRHRCAAALEAADGSIHTGINLIHDGVPSVHAEPIALGGAISNSVTEITASVAVVYAEDDSSQPMEVVAPCGSCRDLLWSFCGECRIIVPTPSGPGVTQLSALRPASPR